MVSVWWGGEGGLVTPTKMVTLGREEPQEQSGLARRQRGWESQCGWKPIN